MTDLDFLWQCAWKGSILLFTGFAVAALLRRRSAALRHIVWVACFAALLVLPLAMRALPQWGVFKRTDVPPVSPPAAAAVAVVTASNSPAAPLPPSRNVPLTIWLAGAGLVALWYLLGIARTSWMVRRAAPAADANELVAALVIRRRVRILASAATPMPLTWGVFRPVVVLPRASATWPAARLRTVLLHELVHVKRLDLLAQAVGQAACCLYWFHPLAWVAARQLRKEREQACDDAVLARGVSGPEYAGHLMDLVRALRPNPWRQAPAMAEVSGLELRARALLDSKRDRRPLSRRKGFAIASLGTALLLPLAAVSETTTVKPVATQPSAPPAIVTPAPQAAPPVRVPLRVFPRHIVAATTAPADPLPAPPQATIGSIAGTVRDPSGAVVPGCSVVVKNADGSSEQTVTTDAVGRYQIDSLLSGRYSLQVQASGFSAYKLDQVPVGGGNIAQINVNLQVGSISESVTVQGKRSAVATPQAATNGRIKVGGNVQPARLVRQPRPQYPAELQQEGVEGTVTLTAIISKDGIPMSLHVVPSSVDSRLVPLALDAVGQWRYSPMLLNGEPVETVTRIDVTFKLDQ